MKNVPDAKRQKLRNVVVRIEIAFAEEHVIRKDHRKKNSAKAVDAILLQWQELHQQKADAKFCCIISAEILWIQLEKQYYGLLLKEHIILLDIDNIYYISHNIMKNKIEVTAIEDLMREHGILNRLLLLYEASIRLLESGNMLGIKIIRKTAILIRVFVEDYHEKTEEKYIFPMFTSDDPLRYLVDELLKQHAVGRKLTDDILILSKPIDKPVECRRLIFRIKQFILMYRFHETREDTVIFDNIRKKMDKKQYDELGEITEEDEHNVLGKGGYDKVKEKVSLLEKLAGISDISQFTPLVN